MQKEIANIAKDGYLHQFRNYLEEKEISKESVEKLLQLFTVKRIAKDGLFADQGEVSDRFGFVCSGCFVMFGNDLKGEIDVKEFIGENSFVLSLWNSNISLATIKSLTDSIILEASYSEVKKIYAQDKKLGNLAKKSAEERISVICEQMHALKNKTAMERYLDFQKKYGDMEKNIPQYLVASYLGVTPTQLSRIRKNLD